MPAVAIVAGNPEQIGYEFFTTANGQVSVGVWDSAAYTEIKAAYAADEFMLLLEGSLEIE